MKKKKNEWKSNGLNIFSDKSNLHCSFDTDDDFIIMSDIGSNCQYFAYEPALKYSFEMNLLQEMKSCSVIVRWALRSNRKAILYEALPNGHPSKY